LQPCWIVVVRRPPPHDRHDQYCRHTAPSPQLQLLHIVAVITLYHRRTIAAPSPTTIATNIAATPHHRRSCNFYTSLPSSHYTIAAPSPHHRHHHRHQYCSHTAPSPQLQLQHIVAVITLYHRRTIAAPSPPIIAATPHHRRHTATTIAAAATL
jgi:hypothetical protein